MKVLAWNADKNASLRGERGVSFEDVVIHILTGDIVDTVDHPKQQRYPGQKIHLIDIEGYIYLVPFLESDDEVFLKTIIPSRKATRNYKASER